MEEESTSDDPLTLIKPTTSFNSFPQKLSSPLLSENTPDFNNLIDEFVDLSEWGALSDGDLCMSRQLAATIGQEGGDGKEEEANLGRKEEEMNTEEKKGENEEMEEEDEFEEEEVEFCEINQVVKPTGNLNNSVGEWHQFAEQNIKYENNNNMNVNYLNNGNNNIVRDRETESEFVYQYNNPQNEASSSSPGSFLQVSDHSPLALPPPPIVISPQEVDNLTITLEKNQQCACSECGKLFNSVWYLKQHAVKHSNDRPFKCRFCMKTYKFRSNLYQHKCPERNRLLVAGEFNMIGHPYRRRAYTRSADKKKLKEHKIQMLQNQKQQFNNDKQLNGVNHQQSLNPTISINTTPTPSSTFGKELYSPQHVSGQQKYPSGIKSEENGLLMMGNGMGKNGNLNGTYTNYLAQQGVVFMNDNCSPSVNSSSNLATNKPSFMGELNGQYEDNGFNNKSESIEENRTLSTEVLEEYLHKNRHRVERILI
ncbi:unnamed protein product [Meloidogyne enterolobii]|uniref:Uncharacterized protein n=1 Tax=Meloidogyne enterolobii TaxID=390850 RepID=A0ACB1AVS5_MELEN